MSSWVTRVDRYQRRHPVLGFPIAVIYKYFDDQGPYLAAILTYYSFVAIFPLLLISSSVLGFILQGDPQLRDRLLNSVLAQFPIVGDQLGRPEGLAGSTSAIVIGALVATYGSLGLGQAAQNAADVTWAVPRNKRNAVVQRLRSVIILAFAGLGVLILTVTSSLLAAPDAAAWESRALGWASRILGAVLSALIVVGLYRLMSSGSPSVRAILSGSLVVAVAWQVVQLGGSAYVTHVVTEATTSDMNQTFALVLGLLGFLFVVSALVVIGHEINVVAHRRLYPRALLTPFTDNVSLTAADRKAYTHYAMSQRHKGFQSIETSFTPAATRAKRPAADG